MSDFFCHDDTWRMVLSRLVGESDVVIMDLRRFSPRNAGCVFEISELVNLMPFGRVLFIVDDSTDEPFLRQVLQQAWDRMSVTSPNRQFDPGTSSLLRLDRLGDRELRRLLATLAKMVDFAPSTQRVV